MILPIHVYGDPVLRVQTVRVESNSDELQRLIDDMLQTMYGATGIGLAAPQVGRSERLFVVDLTPLVTANGSESDGDADGREMDHHADYDVDSNQDSNALPAQPMVFINPEITEESDDEDEYEEGCLSIPDIHESVVRPVAIRISYLDREFNEQSIWADGMLARVIQHEFDHLDGVLFIDRISAFRRRLLQRRLREMAKGNVEAEYPLAI